MPTKDDVRVRDPLVGDWVYVRNLSETPIVVNDSPHSHMLEGERISPVPAQAWQAFLQHEFGAGLNAQGMFVLVDEALWMAQPMTPMEIADAEERDEKEAMQAGQKGPRVASR